MSPEYENISLSNFRNAELDPKLSPTPFQVQTNWHVITGASCSGKSTLIDKLGAKGFNTLPEVAREYFEGELNKGRSLNEIRKDRAAFTYRIFELMAAREKSLQSSKVVFLDRGLPDIIGYLRYAGMDPNIALHDCLQNRYASVFKLDRLPYIKDDVRAGDDNYADYFDTWISRDYSALGYKVISVPVLTPDERLDFILERLAEKGNI